MGKNQAEYRRLLPEEPQSGASFNATLLRHGQRLTRNRTHTLQINMGLVCNQACRHCHLEAGPHRTESMDRPTVDAVIAYARQGGFELIDITGGAPELNPHLPYLIREAAKLVPQLSLRSNLSALNDGTRDHLFEIITTHGITVVASLPSLNAHQTNSQRGAGTFATSINALQKLNGLGYGKSGSGLELNLVSNPSGAFLPPSQVQTEARFRRVLKEKFGIEFNNLYAFANVPLGRFRQWLIKSGNLDTYINKLSSSFNPCAVDGLMCRSLVNVAWDGTLYDCDFNQVRGIFLGGRKVHVSRASGPPEIGTKIATADHCYTCTAGSGFT